MKMKNKTRQEELEKEIEEIEFEDEMVGRDMESKAKLQQLKETEKNCLQEEMVDWEEIKKNKEWKEIPEVIRFFINEKITKIKQRLEELKDENK